MDHAQPQDAHQGKGSMLRHREHSDESVDKRSTDSSVSPAQAERRPIRRVRSPSRPRAWMSNYYKPKFSGKLYKPRDDHSFYKPGFGHRKYYHLHPRAYFHHKDHFQLKPQHAKLKEREREEKERYEQRESTDGSSPPSNRTMVSDQGTKLLWKDFPEERRLGNISRQLAETSGSERNASRAFLSRSTSSRDKDMHFMVSDRNQSRERDHRGTKSKERERSRDGELPSTASQAVARDRAIQQKRREIDEVYYQECEMFGLVAKMLIAKDQSLERPIQSSLQENLRDIGKRCVEAMEKFIEDYDSRELSH